MLGSPDAQPLVAPSRDSERASERASEKERASERASERARESERESERKRERARDESVLQAEPMARKLTRDFWGRTGRGSVQLSTPCPLYPADPPRFEERVKINYVRKMTF